MVTIPSRLSAALSLVELMLFKSGSDTWTQRLQNSTPRKPRSVSTRERTRITRVIAAEGDLVQFSKIASHFSSEQTDSKEMFKPDTRPNAVRRLYEEAGNEDKVEKVVHVNCESIL